MSAKRYSNPQSFKQAIELRLKRSVGAEGSAALHRKRQIAIFERFLARIFATFGDQATLKGGMVLELRLQGARSTKDLDFRLLGSPDELAAKLEEAGRLDLGDYMSFTCEEDPRHPTIEGEGVLYEGRRYRIQCFLAGKIYGALFGLDASFADAIIGPIEELEGSDFFQFAGFEPVLCRVYPLVSHIAEKLHAYTLPRQGENSRVKDLPDLGLLARCSPLQIDHLREGIELTFVRRRTHEVPSQLPSPPQFWEPLYAAMAAEEGLEWANLEALFQALEGFLNPVLGGTKEGVWSPEDWRW